EWNHASAPSHLREIDREVLVVAGKLLVSTLAIKQDWDSRHRCNFKNQPLSVDTRGSEGFIVMPYDIIDGLPETIKTRGNGIGVDACRLHNLVDEVAFIDTRMISGSRERLLDHRRTR